mgnify:CR=1 FL=1
MTTGRIDPRYGNPSATAPAGTEIERLLTDAQLYWIVTVRADGRPHAVPLVGVWHDGSFAFCTGAVSCFDVATSFAASNCGNDIPSNPAAPARTISRRLSGAVM